MCLGKCAPNAYLRHHFELSEPPPHAPKAASTVECRGEVADQAGVNAQTLRYYERRGLLPEPRRRESGYRIYGPEAVGLLILTQPQAYRFGSAVFCGHIEPNSDDRDGAPGNR